MVHGAVAVLSEVKTAPIELVGQAALSPAVGVGCEVRRLSDDPITRDGTAEAAGSTVDGWVGHRTCFQV